MASILDYFRQQSAYLLDADKDKDKAKDATAAAADEAKMTMAADGAQR